MDEPRSVDTEDLVQVSIDGELDTLAQLVKATLLTSEESVKRGAATRWPALLAENRVEGISVNTHTERRVDSVLASLIAALVFAVKMTSLLLAIIFTFTVRRKVALADEGRVGPLWSRLVAVVSVALWSGVGIGGRWIGFS